MLESEPIQRLRAAEIAERKGQTPLVCLTAYTAPMAALLDPHCDLLLVGDSVSMVLYGKDSTRGASMPMMIAHGQAVMKGSERACVIVDMPYGSYEDSENWALRCAGTIVSKTNCCGVKLEGGEKMASQIATLVEEGIPVMGHIGLRPQSIESADGFRVQGKDDQGAQQIIKDAKAVADAGAFAIVIEAVPEPLAAQITAEIAVPTIGIGASAACDGQILVTEDMLGMTQGHKPKFVKTYVNLGKDIDRAIAHYADDVRGRAFPDSNHTYAIKKAS